MSKFEIESNCLLVLQIVPCCFADAYMTPSKELKFEIRNKPENPKSETRNPKQIQITEIPMIKTAFNIIFRRWFFIVLDFVL